MEHGKRREGKEERVNNSSNQTITFHSQSTIAAQKWFCFFDTKMKGALIGYNDDIKLNRELAR